METPEQEIHMKEFLPNLYSTCFSECVSNFSNGNLTPAEGKCLKSCYSTYPKKLELVGQALGFDAKLSYNFGGK